MWLREMGCGWDASTWAGAAEGGHLEILKWARLNGCRGTWQSQGSSTCPFGDKVNGITRLVWKQQQMGI